VHIEIKLSREEVNAALLEYARKNNVPRNLVSCSHITEEPPTQIVFKEGDEYWQSFYDEGMIAYLIWEAP
jgi:hypothetical protein